MSNMALTVTAVWALAMALDRSEIERAAALVDSEMDVLTKGYNRRHLDQRLTEEVQRCVRHLRTSAFILFDVDHFKNVNDRFGHPAGDGVLKTIADACRKTIRVTDVLCRFGGEEFAIIAPETSGKDAMILAAKLRAAVALLVFVDVPTSVTISLGVAEMGRESRTPDQVISAADDALYRAKELGRNRECLSGEVFDPAFT
jgi:diguanylate cyclase (GGDEF)-like protein